MEEVKVMTTKQMKLEQEISEMETMEDLRAFYKAHQSLTVNRLAAIEDIDPRKIINILYDEVSKKDDADIDIDTVTRSFTLSGKVKKAVCMIDDYIDWLPMRSKVRKIQNYLDVHLSAYSLHKAVCHVISRDYGKTCVRITDEDIDRAVVSLEKDGKVVTPKTVENYLYDTLPHEQYLSEAERKIIFAE